ncbi:hypothetical protein D4Q76_02715 [archaeon]|nr:MAG: hypothetical protein D4Q76_02715 [archaeon]
MCLACLKSGFANIIKNEVNNMLGLKKYEWFDKKNKKWNLILNMLGIPYAFMGICLVLATIYNISLPIIKNIELNAAGFGVGLAFLIIFYIKYNHEINNDRIERLEAALEAKQKSD